MKPAAPPFGAPGGGKPNLFAKRQAVQQGRQGVVRIDKKELEALKRGCTVFGGKVLQSVLAAEQQATMKHLMAASTENMQRLQGRAVLLDELLKLLTLKQSRPKHTRPAST